MRAWRLVLAMTAVVATGFGAVPASAASTVTCSASVVPSVSGPLLTASGAATCSQAVTQQLTVEIQTQDIRNNTTPLGAGATACPGCTDTSASAVTAVVPGVHYNLGAVVLIVGPSGSTIVGPGCTTLSSNTALCAAGATYNA